MTNTTANHARPYTDDELRAAHAAAAENAERLVAEAESTLAGRSRMVSRFRRVLQRIDAGLPPHRGDLLTLAYRDGLSRSGIEHAAQRWRVVAEAVARAERIRDMLAQGMRDRGLELDR